MYIFKNALLSITRNKGRNILIGIIIFVIGICATITLAIRSSAESLITSYEDAYEVLATLSVNRDSLMQNFDPQNADTDRESVMEKFNEESNIEITDVEKYGDSNYVKDYYYTLNTFVNSDTITAVTSTNMKGDKGMMHGGEQGATTGDFSITGYSSLSAMEDFISGTYTITDGEVSTDFSGNNCVISSELATANNIKVGDTIKFTNSDDSSITYNLVVTGIYSDNENTGMQMFSNSANKIITNSSFVESMENVTFSVTPTFALTSKDVVDSFTAEVSQKGLSNYLMVSTNLDEVKEETRSISNLKTYATTFLIVTLIIGAVVLFVINMINVRERKYEIGVLRTIGMKKINLSMQFVFETLIVAFISLSLGAAIGSCLSVPVANSMLASEISSSSNTMNNINNNFGGNMDKPNRENNNNSNASNANGMGNMKMQGAVSVDKITSINAVVNITVLGELILIGLLLVAISSIAATISVQRFKPLTILKERS